MKNWIISDDTKIYQDSTITAKSGNSCIKFTSDGYIAQVVYLPEAADLTLSSAITANLAIPGCNVIFEVYNYAEDANHDPIVTGNPIFTKTVVNPSTQVNTGWAFVGVYTFNSGLYSNLGWVNQTLNPYMVVFRVSSLTQGVLIYLDEVQMNKGAAALPYSPHISDYFYGDKLFIEVPGITMPDFKASVPSYVKHSSQGYYYLDLPYEINFNEEIYITQSADVVPVDITHSEPHLFGYPTRIRLDHVNTGANNVLTCAFTTKSTAAINGSMLVNGSISAEKIEAGSITGNLLHAEFDVTIANNLRLSGLSGAGDSNRGSLYQNESPTSFRIMVGSPIPDLAKFVVDEHGHVRLGNHSTPELVLDDNGLTFGDGSIKWANLDNLAQTALLGKFLDCNFSNGNQFKIATSGVITPATTTVQFYTNSGDTISLVSASGFSKNDAGISTPLGPGNWPGNSFTIYPTNTINQIYLNANFGSITLTTTGGVTKTFSLLKINDGIIGVDGSSAKYVVLQSLGGNVFSYETSTSAAVPSSSILEVNIYNFTAVSYQWQYYDNSWLNINGAITSSLSVSPTGTYWNSRKTCPIRCQVSDGNSTYTDEMTFIKAQDGVSPYACAQSNENITLPASYAGVVTSFVTAYDDFTAYRGTTALTAVASNPTTGQFSILVGTQTNCTAAKTSNTRVSITSLTSDSGLVDVTVNFEGVTSIHYYITLSKARAGTDGSPGAPGTPGTPGTPGVSATTYWLTANVPAIQKSIAGVFTPTSVIASIYSATGTAIPALYSGRFIIATSNDGIGFTTAYTSSINEGTYTFNYSAFTSMKALRIRAYMAGGTNTLIDEQILTVVSDGATGSIGPNGLPGTPGIHAISAVLSNESHTFPADINGNVTSYVNSGTSLYVYEGATQLNYDGIGTAAGTWRVTTTPTNITVGDLSDAGTYLVEGGIIHPSGVADVIDTAQIIFNISGTTSLGTVFSLTKIQKFTKAKQGAVGDMGDPGSYLNISSSSGFFFVQYPGTAGTSINDYKLTTAIITASSDGTVNWSSTGLTPAINGTYVTRSIHPVYNPAAPSVHYISAASGVATITFTGSNGLSKTETIQRVKEVNGTKIDANGIYTGYLTFTGATGQYFNYNKASAADVGNGFWVGVEQVSPGVWVPKLNFGNATDNMIFDGSKLTIGGREVALISEVADITTQDLIFHITDAGTYTTIMSAINTLPRIINHTIAILDQRSTASNESIYVIDKKGIGNIYIYADPTPKVLIPNSGNSAVYFSNCQIDITINNMIFKPILSTGNGNPATIASFTRCKGYIDIINCGFGYSMASTHTGQQGAAMYFGGCPSVAITDCYTLTNVTNPTGYKPRLGVLCEYSTVMHNDNPNLDVTVKTWNLKTGRAGIITDGAVLN